MCTSVNNTLTWQAISEVPCRQVGGLDWVGLATGELETQMQRMTRWWRHITDQALGVKWMASLLPSLKLFPEAAFEAPPGQISFSTPRT